VRLHGHRALCDIVFRESGRGKQSFDFVELLVAELEAGGSDEAL